MDAHTTGSKTQARPWAALWALIIGFFMILVDSTIVSVANPAIQKAFSASVTDVLWVTSAYLLAYAVPLLITGRLGDRYGPKNLYLLGLALFTLSSLWCGLTGYSDNIAMLVVARTVQGLGAGIMTPQTMAVITRIFPPDKRGAAMGLWAASSGVSLLVGPLAGGLLVDSAGWEWIFWVNVPVGVIGFILATILVPKLGTHKHRFDWLGVILSGVGMFLIVFGLQEGESYHWGVITGPISVWGLIIVGLIVFAGFIVWQHFNRAEPLLPLRLFRDRNFAVANSAITVMGLAITAMPLPLTFYNQVARGLTPTESALLLVPMAILTGLCSPSVGKLADRVQPRWVVATGFLVCTLAMMWQAMIMTASTPIWVLMLPNALLGIGMSGIWAPLATSATRNLPPEFAGAGAGVYNATRQFGAVIGSAAINALMNARLVAQIPGYDPTAQRDFGGALPAQLVTPFSGAMSQSMWLTVAAFAAGLVVAFLLIRPRAVAPAQAPAPAVVE